MADIFTVHPMREAVIRTSLPQRRPTWGWLPVGEVLLLISTIPELRQAGAVGQGGIEWVGGETARKWEHHRDSHNSVFGPGIAQPEFDNARLPA
ncbi:MAG: hypothetical protein H6965_09675 [Chromatiaceae bacterium]|nr:hypothetical protein [Chromatiaceae bacterium]